MAGSTGLQMARFLDGLTVGQGQNGPKVDHFWSTKFAAQTDGFIAGVFAGAVASSESLHKELAMEREKRDPGYSERLNRHRAAAGLLPL